MAPIHGDEFRPSLLGDALRRYWALIAVCTIAFALGAALLAAAKPVMYTASAKVLLRPTLGNPLDQNTSASGSQVTIAMQTEATLVNSDPVASLSKSNSNAQVIWTPGSGTVKAAVPPNTQVLLITFSARTAKTAQAGAQSVADAYLTYRQNQTVATEKTRTDALSKQIASATTKLDAATKAQQSTSTTTSTNATRQVQLLTDQLVSLQDSLSQVQATDAQPGSVLSPAQLPARAAGLDPTIIVLAGALAGLGLGCVLAIALTRADKRVRRSAVSVADVPVLAVLGPRRSRFSRRVVTTGGTGLRAAYQRLRTGVLASLPPGSTLTVADVRSGGSACEVAAELGASFARAGYQVRLIIAAEDPATAQLLGVEGREGLAEVLSGARPFTADLLVEWRDVEVLPLGRDVDELPELLSGDRFMRLLEELSEGVDYLLVSAPSAPSPAGVAVGRVTRGLLLVGRELGTTTSEIDDVTERAELVGARVLGLALRSKMPTRLGVPGRHPMPVPAPAPVDVSTHLPDEFDQEAVVEPDRPGPGSAEVAENLPSGRRGA